MIPWHWFLHFTGANDESGTWYGFWSGAGSDLSELAGLLAIFGSIYRKHNCHEPRCWRIGRHVVDGTPWCDRHHQQARKGDADEGH